LVELRLTLHLNFGTLLTVIERVIHNLQLKLAQVDHSLNTQSRAGQHHVPAGSSTSSISSLRDGNFDGKVNFI